MWPCPFKSFSKHIGSVSDYFSFRGVKQVRAMDSLWTGSQHKPLHSCKVNIPESWDCLLDNWGLYTHPYTHTGMHTYHRWPLQRSVQWHVARVPVGWTEPPSSTEKIPYLIVSLDLTNCRKLHVHVTFIYYVNTCDLCKTKQYAKIKPS